jgi:hypothetical protein
MRENNTLPSPETAVAGQQAYNYKSFESFRAFDMYVARSGLTDRLNRVSLVMQELNLLKFGWACPDKYSY